MHYPPGAYNRMLSRRTGQCRLSVGAQRMGVSTRARWRLLRGYPAQVPLTVIGGPLPTETASLSQWHMADRHDTHEKVPGSW